MRFFDLDAFAATPLVAEPFPYLVVPGFMPRAALDAVAADYPRIEKPGSFPTSELAFGPSFRDFLAALEGPALRDAFAAKFAMDLAAHPTMVTVRGRAQRKDGQIHADSKTKLITVLIYMNARWEAPGGRLGAERCRSRRGATTATTRSPATSGGARGYATSCSRRSRRATSVAAPISRAMSRPRR